MSVLQIIRIDMKLATEDVNMLAFTSEQISSPFLLSEMVISFEYFYSLDSCDKLMFSATVHIRMFWCVQVERVASMLNYFLLQLVGPQRKSLSLKDPEKYEFRPKELLKQVSKRRCKKLEAVKGCV